MSMSGTKLNLLSLVVLSAAGKIDPAASEANAIAHIENHYKLQSVLTNVVSGVVTAMFDKFPKGFTAPLATLRQSVVAQINKQKLLGDGAVMTPAVIEQINAAVDSYFEKNMTELDDEGFPVGEEKIFFSQKGRNGGTGLLKDLVLTPEQRAKKLAAAKKRAEKKASEAAGALSA